MAQVASGLVRTHQHPVESLFKFASKAGKPRSRSTLTMLSASGRRTAETCRYICSELGWAMVSEPDDAFSTIGDRSTGGVVGLLFRNGCGTCGGVLGSGVGVEEALALGSAADEVLSGALDGLDGEPESSGLPAASGRGPPLAADAPELNPPVAVSTDEVAHRKEDAQQDYYNKECAQQLLVAEDQFAFTVDSSHWVCFYCLPSDLLSPLSAYFSSARLKFDRMSSGRGNTTVVFFSAPISTNV